MFHFIFRGDHWFVAQKTNFKILLPTVPGMLQETEYIRRRNWSERLSRIHYRQPVAATITCCLLD